MEYELSRNMRGMKPSIIREILKQMSDPSLISFAGGNPAPESFPNEEIAAASARLLAQDPAGMLQYSVTEGVPAVLEQVRRFANRHELRVRGQDALLLCTGSQQVLDLATKCLCNEGDTIAVEEPAFLGAYNTFRSYGAKLACPWRKTGWSWPRWRLCLPRRKSRAFSIASPISKTPPERR